MFGYPESSRGDLDFIGSGGTLTGVFTGMTTFPIQTGGMFPLIPVIFTMVPKTTLWHHPLVRRYPKDFADLWLLMRASFQR
jgi:hypothetical protein